MKASVPALSRLFLTAVLRSGAFAGEIGPQVAQTHHTTFLDWTQAHVSDALSSTAAWFDHFFAPHREEIETNQSFLRVIGTYQWINREGFHFRPRFRLKLRLPRLKERLSIIVSGDDREEEVEVDDKTALQSGTGVPLEENSKNQEVAVQYTAREWVRTRVDFNVGVRSKLEPEATARFRQKLNVTSLTQGRFTLTGFWRETIGFGEITQMDFERYLSRKVILAWNNRATYSEKSTGLDWETGLNLEILVSTTSGVIVQTFASGPTRPQTVVENYRIGVRYRQNVYRHWFFYEVEPAVDYPRADEKGRSSIPSVFFRVEILFRKQGLPS